MVTTFFNAARRLEGLPPRTAIARELHSNWQGSLLESTAEVHKDGEHILSEVGWWNVFTTFAVIFFFAQRTRQLHRMTRRLSRLRSKRMSGA